MSDITSLIIDGLPSIDLMATAGAEMYHEGMDPRIIPCVVEWAERRHGLVTFHLTQVLTGHSCFRSYMKRIAVYRSTEFPICFEVEEDVEHALFVCPRFREERELYGKASCLSRALRGAYSPHREDMML